MTRPNEPESGDPVPRIPVEDGSAGPHPAEAVLHEYVDGLLSPAQRARVDAHVGVCSSCRDEVWQLGSLTANLGSLPIALPPERDLFPAITARIDAGEVPGRASPGSSLRARRNRLAAAAVALIAITSLVTATLERRMRTAEAPSALRIGSEGGARSAGASAAAVEFSGLEASYRDAVREILAALEVRRQELSPSTVRILEESLVVIDRALAEARAALARDPGDPVVREVLVTTYEQKLDLLRRTAEIARRG